MSKNESEEQKVQETQESNTQKKNKLRNSDQSTPKLGRNLQIAGRNFANGFRSLFGIPQKPPLSSNPDLKENNRNRPLFGRNKQGFMGSPEEKTDSEKLEYAEEEWEKIYSELLAKYRQDFDVENKDMQFRQKMKLKRLEGRNRHVLQFFEKQKLQMNQNRLNRKNEVLKKRKDQKLRRLDRREESQRKWDRVVSRNQQRVENIIRGVNRFGWRLQFRIILIILPLLLLLIVIYIIVRPFLGAFI